MTGKDNFIFLEHILDSIENINEFTDGVSKEVFLGNKEKQSAVVRQIEIIGEAVKNLPLTFRKKYPEVPWREIVGTRDKMIHHYFGVDLNVVWDIVKGDLVELKKSVERILEKRS